MEHNLPIADKVRETKGTLLRVYRGFSGVIKDLPLAGSLELRFEGAFRVLEVWGAGCTLVSMEVCLPRPSHVRVVVTPAGCLIEGLGFRACGIRGSRLRVLDFGI